MGGRGARVEATGIAKVVDGIPLLAPIDVTAAPGECVVLRGPNGSGKTTALNLLTGRWSPTSGSVTIDDVVADERDPALRARVAALLGAPALYRDMTLVDHLTLIDATWGRDPDTCANRAQGALGEWGLDDLATRFPHELSSGQSQLFALTVTLFRPGDLLVLDEPEQRLDTAWRTRLGEQLHGRAQDGTTVVLACHDLAVTAAVADRVIDVGAP